MTLRSLISTFITRPFKLGALRKARAEYAALCAAYDNAVRRRDSRDQGRIAPSLQAAARAVLAAENALYKPKPLPRPVQASKARSAG